MQLFTVTNGIPALALFLQAEGSGSGIPWWIWLVLIAVLLLLLFIGFARQTGPGEPLPKSEERSSLPTVATKETNQNTRPEPQDEATDVAQESQAAAINTADEVADQVEQS